MSLDVYLLSETPTIKSSSGIFLRESGSTREFSVEEWNARFPDQQVTIDPEEYESNWVYEANITHNLNTMADACGAYNVVWRPEGNGIQYASQLIEPLAKAIAELESRPDYYKQYNPANGWGTYDVLLQFLQKYLRACADSPTAQVKVSR